MTTLRLWTAEDDRLVLDPALSASDVARRVGRTTTAVYARRQVLRGTSSKPRWRTKGFPHLPKGHTAWLIAKTCRRCDEFLPASEFAVRSDGGRQTLCRECQSARVIDRLKSDATYRERFTAQVSQRQRGLQREATDGARNHGKEWTGPELELVMREDLTDKEKAATLGRTFYAVRHKIRKMRAGDPRTVHLAGLPTRPAQIGQTIAGELAKETT